MRNYESPPLCIWSLEKNSPRQPAKRWKEDLPAFKSTRREGTNGVSGCALGEAEFFKVKRKIDCSYWIIYQKATP